jgi:hypothetical protein
MITGLPQSHPLAVHGYVRVCARNASRDRYLIKIHLLESLGPDIDSDPNPVYILLGASSPKRTVRGTDRIIAVNNGTVR